MATDVLRGFVCRVCGERHDLPFSYSFKAPVAVANVPPAEIESRVIVTKDQCVLDQRDLFLRGRILVPVHGSDEPFIWGVWAEVSPKNFLRTQEMWNNPGREFEPAFPGYLNSIIPVFGNTLNLQVDVQTQIVGRRPHFFVKDADHPLAREQREGITLERVEEIAQELLHPDD